MTEKFNISPEEVKEGLISLGFEEVGLHYPEQKEERKEGYKRVAVVEGYVNDNRLPEGSKDLRNKIKNDLVHPDNLEEGDITWGLTKTIRTIDQSEKGLYCEMIQKI